MHDAPKGFPERDDLRLEGTTVLRRHDGHQRSRVEWIHRFLGRLAATGFPASVPVGHFGGESVAVVGGSVWSATSYVPGDAVGWSSVPDMFAMGAFLAEFHRAAESIDVDEQPSAAWPVAELPGMARALDAVGHHDRPRHVIHGDFTNHNVLASGDPPAPCGAIDFMNAYVEVPLFDLGCALWRSGRPSQEAHSFDVSRVRDYVDGYSSIRPLSADDRAAVPVYLRARGVQIIVKHAARGSVDHGPERRLAWLEAHTDEMTSAVMSAG